jgi:hypothetical protein
MVSTLCIHDPNCYGVGVPRMGSEGGLDGPRDYYKVLPTEGTRIARRPLRGNSIRDARQHELA